MENDTIKIIEIDNEGRLHLVTEKMTFPMIYRTASEVHWNSDKHSLYSPKPKDWTYKMWFDHILYIIEKECNCRLERTTNTIWLNIPENLKLEIEKK